MKRLFSLDALRGLDMLLLTVLGPLVRAAQSGWSCFPPAMMKQFDHGWVGFTLWDIIMPLFIFMCGAAMPFALERRLEEGRGVFWRHVAYRVLLLWFLGALVQGNLTSLDAMRFCPYCNTLHSIACGYLVVAVVMSFKSRLAMIIVPLALTVLYTVLLALGDYGEFTNVAYRCEVAVRKMILPAKSPWVVHASHYTWFLTSMMFAAMTFAGYFATQILRGAQTAWRKAGILFGYAAALFVVGFVSAIWIPCIKPIFTLTFTAQAMGWSVLALAVLYVVTDIWQIRFAAPVLMLFGQFALTAYMANTFFRPVLTSCAHLLGDGVIAHLPKSFAPFTLAVFVAALMVCVLLVRRRLKAQKNS